MRFSRCAFFIVQYVPNWCRAPRAAEAPQNDLAFLKTLASQRAKGAHWKAAYEKFLGYLWYLSETLVGLAFFDDNVSVAEKRNMVNLVNERKGEESPSARAHVLPVADVSKMSLSDFVTSNTLKLFDSLGIDGSFLAKDPSTWPEDQHFQHGVEVVRHLRVVNDTAERGVALISQYLKGSNLTKDEDQRQFLMLCVSEHRKFFDKNGNRIE